LRLPGKNHRGEQQNHPTHAKDAATDELPP
jgi:hypothetical protein